MPFARQTVPQLISQITAAFQALLGVGPPARRSNLGVAAIATAGAVDGQYGYLDWIIDNCLLPDSATGSYADRWGLFKGAPRKGPVAATGTATFGGLSGIPIPAGTILQLQPATSTTPAVQYQTTASGSIGGGGTVTIAIQAIIPSTWTDGTLWNCSSGVSLALVQPPDAGINGTATAAAAITNGAAAETDAAYRARYLQLYSAPPQGGDKQDYVEWAEQVPAVTRAWCVPIGKGPGTVVVYFMEDVAEAAFNGFPQGTNGVATDETRDTPATGDQLVVANWLYPLRPVTALVYAYAPVAAPQNFTLKYVPTAEQSAVEAAIAGILMDEGAPDGITLVYLSDVENAVRAVAGCSTALVMSPTDNISTTVGNLPTLGTCTFL